MHVAIGSDHAGFELKEKLIAFLVQTGYTVLDKGCFSSERADYPDYGHSVAEVIIKKEADFGILMCGSGNGISITANKHKGVRAALCWNSEIALLARQHNDANIVVLPARFISEEEARNCVSVFLTEKFEGGRHKDRVDKIDLK